MAQWWAILAGIFLLVRPSNASILKLPHPPMGFSTWNNFHGEINETLIKDVALAMHSSGLQRLGYNFVNLDDLWAAPERNATGHIVADPDRFPSGAAALGSWLKLHGFRFGLYTARNTRTCSNQMPGSLGNEVLDAETFASYGASFIKNDDCGVNLSHAVLDYGAMQRAIADVPGHAMMHNVKAPDLPADRSRNVSQMRRVGKDLKNTWENMVTRSIY